MTFVARLVLFGFLAGLTTGAAAQAPATPHVDRGEPVVLDGQTLYYGHSFLGIQRPKGHEAPRFGMRVDRAEDGSSRP